jgi:chemotaxis protein MotC
MMQTILAVLTTMLCLGSTGGKAQSASEPDTMMKALHQVQENLAYGDAAAASMQTEILARLELELAKPARTEQERAVRDQAIVGFALSGGNADVSRKLLSQIAKDSAYYQIGQTVTSYASTDMKETSRLFGMIDTQSIPAGLAPYVALARGTAALSSDVNAAIQNFEAVRLNAPGTLLEEVALRRLVALGLTQHDKSTFKSASNLYLRRYLSSPYAGQFVETYANGLVQLLDDEDIDAALKLLDGLSSANRYPLFSRLMTICAYNGRLGVLRQITTNLTIGIADRKSPLGAKSEFYEFVSNVKSLDSSEKLTLAEQRVLKLPDIEDDLIRAKAFQTFKEVFDPLNGKIAEPEAADDRLIQKDQKYVEISSPFEAQIAKLAGQSDSGSAGATVGNLLAAAGFDTWFERRFSNNFVTLKQVDRLVQERGQ